jgi:hypothetical protein
MGSVFAVDPTTGNLIRDRGGFTRISGHPAIVQDLQVYLRLRQGEIPSRLDLGIPWSPLLASGAPPSLLGQVIGEAILSRPGVVAQECQVDVDGQERLATVTYEAQASLADQRRRSTIADRVVVQP